MGVRGWQPSSLFRGWEPSLRLSCALHMSRYSPALSAGQSGPLSHNSSGFLLTCPTLSPLPAASFLLPFQHLKNLSCPLSHSHSSMGRKNRDTVVTPRIKSRFCHLTAAWLWVSASRHSQPQSPHL